MTGQTILIVGGGQNQCGLIARARARGLKTVVTDINKDPPGRALADVFVSLDTKDKEGNLAVARKHHINAVATDQTDAAVPTAAYVAETLGLPGIGYELAVRFTNKFVMREMLRPRLPGHIPEFHYFDHPSQVETFLADQGGPVTQWIVKPHTSQGSKGVSRLVDGSSAEQIWSAYRESNFAGLLVERFIEGREYSVEAFVERGAIHNLAVTCKEHYPENDCIDRRNYYLGDVDAAVERSLYETNTKVISAMGLGQGPTHAEYMVGSDGTVYLMEIAARGGGGNISEKLIPYLTGFSPTEGILNFAQGRSNAMTYDSYRKKFAVMRFVDLPPGRYRPVALPAMNADWFLHFDLDLNREFEARPVRDSRDRLGYFIVKGATPDEALAREAAVMDLIRTAAAGGKA